MCKEMLSALMSKPKEAPPVPPAQVNQAAPNESAAQVQGTDVVDAVTAGTEGSGRVKLGRTAKRGSGAAVGLSI